VGSLNSARVVCALASVFFKPLLVFDLFCIPFWAEMWFDWVLVNVPPVFYIFFSILLIYLGVVDGLPFTPFLLKKNKKFKLNGLNYLN
jgi:hypothetical protein